MELCLKTYECFFYYCWMDGGGLPGQLLWMFFPLHTISESGLDWVADEWRVVAVGNNNNKRIGERKAPLSTVMQLHNEDMIYVGGHNEMGSSHAYICIPAPQLQDYIRSGG